MSILRNFVRNKKWTLWTMESFMFNTGKIARLDGVCSRCALSFTCRSVRPSRPTTTTEMIKVFFSNDLKARVTDKDQGKEKFTQEELQLLAELEEEEAQRKEERLKSEQAEERRLKLQESISQSFIPFQDQQRIIQDVNDEMWNPIPPQEKIAYQPPPEFLLRGKMGVFDLQELLDLIREENCEETVVISIPKELDYADFMVIVTCKSPRHLLAAATYVRKRFKMKDLKKTDVIPRIVSEKGHQGWIALDLGNIILHFFLQRQRDHYDLEMLWTVGPVFDDLCNTKDPDIIQLLNMIQ